MAASWIGKRRRWINTLLSRKERQRGDSEARNPKQAWSDPLVVWDLGDAGRRYIGGQWRCAGERAEWQSPATAKIGASASALARSKAVGERRARPNPVATRLPCRRREGSGLDRSKT